MGEILRSPEIPTKLFIVLTETYDSVFPFTSKVNEKTKHPKEWESWVDGT